MQASKTWSKLFSVRSEYDPILLFAIFANAALRGIERFPLGGLDSDFDISERDAKRFLLIAVVNIVMSRTTLIV